MARIRISELLKDGAKFLGQKIEGGISEDLIMGAYHFARPDNNTAQQDATNFLNVASAYIGTGFLPRRKRNHLRQPAPN